MSKEAADRARLTAHYRNYLIARQNHWDHEDDRALEEQWLVAHSKWIAVEREVNLPRRELSEIYSEVWKSVAPQ